MTADEIEPAADVDTEIMAEILAIRALLDECSRSMSDTLACLDRVIDRFEQMERR